MDLALLPASRPGLSHQRTCGGVSSFNDRGDYAGIEKKMGSLAGDVLAPGDGGDDLVSAPWYLLAALNDPEYVKAFLWNHNILRFFTSQPGIDHSEPIYYLFLILMGGFLPWSLFLPLVLHNLWERRIDEGQEERLLLVVWAATVLLFFSLAWNKLGTYILPAFPPLALLTGDVIRQFVAGEEVRPWRYRWILSGSFFWFFFLLSLPLLSEMILKDRYPQYLSSHPSLIPASLFILFAAIGWVLRKEGWTPWIVSLSSLWVTLWFYGVKAHEISELRSARRLARIVNSSGAERVVAIKPESFSFYLRYSVQATSNIALLRSMLEEPILTVALVKEKHLSEINRLSPSRLFVWTSTPSARALVANFPLVSAQDLGRELKR